MWQAPGAAGRATTASRSGGRRGAERCSRRDAILPSPPRRDSIRYGARRHGQTARTSRPKSASICCARSRATGPRNPTKPLLLRLARGCSPRAKTGNPCPPGAALCVADFGRIVGDVGPLVGHSRRWTCSPCRTAMFRSTALRPRIALNGTFQVWRTHTIDPRPWDNSQNFRKCGINEQQPIRSIAVSARPTLHRRSAVVASSAPRTPACAQRRLVQCSAERAFRGRRPASADRCRTSGRARGRSPV